MNGETPDNDGNITLSASSVGAVGYNTPQSLTAEQQAQARDNINAPAPYEAGDNIAITGRIITTKAFPCNPNLLDNWYFGNPVNQRGQTSYTTNFTYTVDRWLRAFFSAVGKTDVSDGYLALFGANSNFTQILPDYRRKSLCGKQVTFSALCRGAGVTIFEDAQGGYHAKNFQNADYDCIALTFTVKSDADRAECHVQVTGDNPVDIIAVKLELGPQQTLAHQENGAWALNEIPKFGDQLAECQRYALNMIQDDTKYTPMGIGVARSATEIQGKISIPVQMRALPAISTNAADWLVVNGGSYLYPTAISVDGGISPALVNIIISGQGFSPGMAYEIFVNPGGKCILSADL